MAAKARNHPICLEPAVLVDFALGRLPAEELERVAAEVDTCDSCQAVLATLDDLEDSVVRDLKEGSQAGSRGIAPKLQEQIRQARVIARQVWQHEAREPHEDDAPHTSTARPVARCIGPYQLLEKLGQGGMGTVWRALHTRLRRPAAVKLLPPERTRCPQAIARFDREMEAVGRLNHPNLVQAYDAGEADSQHFLAMELLDGLDLRRLVRLHGPLRVADACEVVRQAALGLQHAHGHGIVHRDVKPSNLMLTTAGTVKVLDLGLARLASEESVDRSMTSSEQVMGTGDFLAPEQAEDTRSADGRADIYALGCTLYYLLAGRAPFSGPEYGTFVKKAIAHAREPVPPLAGLRSDIPAGLLALVGRMLAKSPEDRPASAAEVAGTIGPWADGADLQRLLSSVGERSPAADGAVLEATLARSHGSVSTEIKLNLSTQRSRANRGPKRRVWPMVLSVELVVVLVLAALVVLRVRTERGELVVRSDSPQIRVALDQKNGEIQVATGDQAGSRAVAESRSTDQAQATRHTRPAAAADRNPTPTTPPVPTADTSRSITPSSPAIKPRIAEASKLDGQDGKTLDIPGKPIPTLIDRELRLPRSEGPYKIVAAVVVKREGALYFERGTTVLCAPGTKIVADGKIGSYGDRDEFVQFRAATPEGWGMITLPYGTEQLIERFDVRGGAAGLEVITPVEVRDCIFMGNTIGMKVGTRGKQSFRNCLIADNVEDGIRLFGHRIEVDHCTITGNGGVGLHMTYYGTPLVTASEIRNNRIGIKSTHYETVPEVHGSNIVGNDLAIEVNTSETFLCDGNYWGRDQSQLIAEMMTDGRDDVNRGMVVFEPFEKTPVEGAGCSPNLFEKTEKRQVDQVR